MSRLVVGFLAVLLTAGVAHAQVTELRYALITGTASAPTAGACTGQGYADQCPSGNCTCVTVTGATVGAFSTCAAAPNCFPLAGKGTADLFLTFDVGADMPTLPQTPQCTPFFGVANLTTTRHHSPSTETLNLTGVNCNKITLLGQTDNPVLGGFGISSTPAPVNGGTGFGKIRGFYDGSTGAVSLKIHGPITE